MNAKARKRKRERKIKQERSVPDGSQKKKSDVRSTPTHLPTLPLAKDPNDTPVTYAVRGKKFLTPQDGDLYHKILKEHYSGLAVIPAGDLDSDFHELARRALERLRDSGYYQYDMVSAGQKLNRTFVQRTLVGHPGITYKYLGLRLFAHAWSGPSSSLAFRDIYSLNQEMIRQARQQQNEYVTSGHHVGSCDFNLTLINYMEPLTESPPLKEEEHYGMGKVSVSWHADSSLQDNSAIGVYHTLPSQRTAHWDWKIALRRNPNPQRVPPVVVPTHSGDVYCLLGDTNHTHQHMVLAGSTTHRISSTHRVAINETYDSVRTLVSKALVGSKAELRRLDSLTATPNYDIDVLLESQAALTNVEFEWIAQYWVQGAQHDVQHAFWQAPMRALEQAWVSLEKVTYKLFTICCRTVGPLPPLLLIEGLLSSFETRYALRQEWDLRRADKAYRRRISLPYQPVERPIFEYTKNSSKKRLPKDLTKSILTLKDVLEKRMVE